MTDIHELDNGGYVHALDPKTVYKQIWRVTIYLTILTIAELALGIMMMHWPEESFQRHLVKGIILVLMFWKAFYIIGYFMHLKHEKRNMITLIGLPATLFVWFVIAFLYDGNSFKNLRTQYTPYQVELHKLPMPSKETPGDNTHEIKPAEKPEQK